MQQACLARCMPPTRPYPGVPCSWHGSCGVASRGFPGFFSRYKVYFFRKTVILSGMGRRPNPVTECPSQGCENLTSIKGLCVRCYYQVKAGREPGPKREKLCQCGSRALQKGECGSCYSKRRYRERNAQSSAAKPSPKTPENLRLIDRHRRTGVSVPMVHWLREKQGGKCAICCVVMEVGTNNGNTECSDHRHIDGRPRGLLCKACNISLGWYERYQQPAGLRIASYEEYLSRPPAPPPPAPRATSLPPVPPRPF